MTIEISNRVNISEKRFNEIFDIASVIADDLNIADAVIEVSPSAEMIEMYDADGLCCDEHSIEIINKRDKKELFEVISHELRHLYQYLNKLMVNQVYEREVDAVEYEKKSFKKFKKRLDF